MGGCVNSCVIWKERGLLIGFVPKFLEWLMIFVFHGNKSSLNAEIQEVAVQPCLS